MCSFFVELQFFGKGLDTKQWLVTTSSIRVWIRW